jgi:hypothetical protein
MDRVAGNDYAGWDYCGATIMIWSRAVIYKLAVVLSLLAIPASANLVKSPNIPHPGVAKLNTFIAKSPNFFISLFPN